MGVGRSGLLVGVERIDIRLGTRGARNRATGSLLRRTTSKPDF